MKKYIEIFLLAINNIILLSPLWILSVFIGFRVKILNFNFTFNQEIFYSIIWGIILVILLLLYFLPKHILKVDKIKKDYFPGKYLVRQERELFLIIDKKDLFDLCKKSLERLKINNFVYENFDEGKLTIETKGSNRSFGEKIIFKLDNNRNGFLLNIQSKPKVFTTSLDYGKDLENITKIENFLQKNLNKNGT